MSGNLGKHKNIGPRTKFGPGDSEPLLKILRNIRDIAGIGAISTVENSRELYAIGSHTSTGGRGTRDCGTRSNL